MSRKGDWGKKGNSIRLNQESPSHGDTINFTITTDVERPFVRVTAYTPGNMGIDRPGYRIYQSTQSYWYGSIDFILSSLSWQTGPADVRAELWYPNRLYRKITLAQTEFQVTA